jgi:type II secretory pathway component PulF
MPSYQYKARDKFGKLVMGLMGAGSENEVAVKLKEAGFVPVGIKAAEAESGVRKIFHGFGGVKFSDVNMFTRQFYTLQKAGLPILSSLNALKEQAVNKAFRDVLAEIYRDIEAGAGLSSALERHPAVFSPLYVNMIKAGEASGRLDQILERLSILGEHDELIRMRIQSASRYPAIVVLAIISGFAFLTTIVIPRFSSIFSQFNTALPLPTQILININFIIRQYWWLLIIIFSIIIYALRSYISTKQGRLFWDSLKLRLPVFGPLTLKLAMSRFTRITATLMRSGVPLMQILDLSAAGAGNMAISGVIIDIKESVNEGRGMLEPMRKSGFFPVAVIQMVSVGEETGKLDELLMHVSDYYDTQVDYTVNNLVSLIEPMLIFVLGIGVLFMALGIFLPMWNLMNLFKG